MRGFGPSARGHDVVREQSPAGADAGSPGGRGRAGSPGGRCSRAGHRRRRECGGRRLAAERGGFYVDQFHAPDGVRAHAETTGPEIWAQSSGRIDAWLAAVGTGATFLGVAAALRARNPRVICAAVEPDGCQPLAGLAVTKPRHLIQGTSYGSVPPHWSEGLMDLSLAVTDQEVERWRRALATQEGLHVGYSAAANVAAAAALLRSGRLPADATAVTVLCDTGLKY
ncbi:pyridoxal-phosphate dependent enzyme [Methylobacterium currus]|uniref:pyridoxal-phosphate dependent enzyme n=1 Tax=Methylobacterium currus TaxID=2051553 RepID=UPI0023EA4C63|nr:pyridoxal-phosphate dependent enzyme [Methylobacterium currus]